MLFRDVKFLRGGGGLSRTTLRPRKILMTIVKIKVAKSNKTDLVISSFNIFSISVGRGLTCFSVYFLNRGDNYRKEV